MSDPKDHPDVLQERIRQSEANLEKAKDDLAATREKLESTHVHVRNLTAMLNNRPSQRVVRLAKRGAAFAQQGRGGEDDDFDLDSGLDDEVLDAQATLVQQLTIDRAELGHSQQGPLVTIAIVTRDGIHHMARLLEGLASRTSYEAFEVVVVDNQSSDETVALCRQPWPFDLRLIENDTNRSFSEANNQAVEVANGEYVLFLNNDVDPINDGWLGALVDALEGDHQRGAAGALLIYPDTKDRVDSPHAKPLTVQHRGIRFRYEDSAPKGYNVGHGEDPLETTASDITSYPGVTAACMLVRSNLLTEVGAFSGGYVYGTEDVDLSLKIRNSGHDIVLVAGAALFHHEFGTQNEMSNRVKQINRSSNRILFLETWGPTLHRLMGREALGADRFWSSDDRPTVLIIRPPDDHGDRWEAFYVGDEIGEAMTQLGWDVTYTSPIKPDGNELGEAFQLVISLDASSNVQQMPATATKVAWLDKGVERWMEQPWLCEFDLVVTSTEQAARRVFERIGREALVMELPVNAERFAPKPPDVTYESDFVFAGNHCALSRELVDSVLVRPQEKFVMFGTGWDTQQRFQRYWRGVGAYEDRPKVYSSAKIVLDIAGESDRDSCAVNARMLDALASGSLVISNDEGANEKLFDGQLPTYSGRDDLRQQLDRYLGDDQLREKTARSLRSMLSSRRSYRDFSQDLLDAVGVHHERPRVRIKIGPPTWAVAEEWGDTHFARHFASALAGQGYSTAIDVLDNWDAPTAQDADIVIHLRGLVPYVPKQGQVNVLWVISHPSDVSGAECDGFDLVFVASETFAKQLAKRTSTPVHTMLQATSPSVFSPRAVDPDLATDLLFVGNSRGVMRPAVEMAIQRGLPVRVYGAGWADLIPAEYVVDEYFPNERLAELYSSSKLLLNDHWEDMREAGFISNRLFDALACGTVVVTDRVLDIETVFPAALPQFEDADSLVDVVNEYLGDASLRESVAAEGMAAVLKDHTFEQRAATFADLVQPLLAAQRAKLRL